MTQYPLDNRAVDDPPAPVLAGWIRFRTNERTATMTGRRGRREYTCGRHRVTVIDRRPR